MKVFIADSLPQPSLDALSTLGFDLVVRPDTTADDLPAHVGDADVLIVRSTNVTANALDAASALRLIIRAGAGTSNIDTKHASSRAVFVANCPGKNAVAVAELTIGLLISLDRRIPSAHTELAAGRWNKKEFSRASGLQGRTLAVAGVGQIGRAVITRAKALGMKVRGWSRTLTPERAEELGIDLADSLLTLAKCAHALSIHLPLTPETRGAVNADVIAALADGALIVNVSRGGVVDETAVLDALNAGRIRYGSDVFGTEPGSSVADFQDAIAAHPLAICTPHIGASTDQAQRAVADEAVRILREFRDSGVVHHCVNLCAPEGGWQLTVRHFNRVGVLATVLGLLRDASINVEELENRIFVGDIAACALIVLSGAPSDEVLAAVKQCPDVIGIALRQLP